jgi:hypothetical protein
LNTSAQGIFSRWQVQGHGVGHQLEALVQGAVVLAVEQFLPLVGDAQERLGAGVVLTRSVDLQLHAEVAGTAAVEDGVRLVAVIVDGPGPGGPCIARGHSGVSSSSSR